MPWKEVRFRFREGYRAMTDPKSLRVLIVDDDALICNVIQNELETIGHRIAGRASDGKQAVELAESLDPDVILMDISMPEMNGLEAARLIQERHPKPVVLLTAHEDQTTLEEASRVGVGAYLVKPPYAQELARSLSIAVARFADLMEVRRLNEELRTALNQVKLLSGLLPICSGCKRIRDDQGYWHQVECYIREHSEVEFSHGICPECYKRLYPEFCQEDGRE
jgi:AmiR/NasT family two-component response regulator